MRIIVAFLINLMVNFAVGLLVAYSVGPEQFGRFALAMGLGAALQVLFFDWLRFAATRFHSGEPRAERTEVRATLDRGFLLVGLALAAVVPIAAGLGALGFRPADFSPDLVAGGVFFAIANGYFDYQAALLRARFEDRAYARLVLAKNAFALVLTAGTAYATGSALATLAGASLGLIGAVLTLRATVHDRKPRIDAPRTEILRDSFAYGFPLCISSLLYLLIPLANRAAASGLFGFAETGQLALAQDVSLRLVLAIGTALDVLLFQFAVRAEQTQGREGARAQISNNMGIVFAITLPCVAGIWLVLPSFEALIVPAQYRGPFAHYFALLLPGLFCFGLASFALAPAFQMARRTWPVSVAAGFAVVTDLALAALLPGRDDATSLALAQTGALCSGFAALLAFASLALPKWPRAFDILTASGATVVMIASTLPLRSFVPGGFTLVLQAIAGAAIYLAFVAAFDIAALRTSAWRAFRAARLAKGD